MSFLKFLYFINVIYYLTIIFFKCKGSDYSNGDAATIRANYPIPPQCKLFYFEVEIINMEESRYFFVLLKSIFLIFAHNFFDSTFQKRDWS